ncbi:MAG TPA: DUF4236 domain-containing protein [Candidatus Binataceae bacterium]|nr:DUF4236 domain-containing protein [Candidatus Binataceae bacterium]
MGNFRFYRRMNILPGLSVNLSKSGPSLTMGVRGAHVTIGGTGIRKTVGIPGTGIYYTSRRGYNSGLHSAHIESPISEQQQAAAHRAAFVIAIIVIMGLALLAGVVIGSALGHG